MPNKIIISCFLLFSSVLFWCNQVSESVDEMSNWSESLNLSQDTTVPSIPGSNTTWMTDIPLTTPIESEDKLTQLQDRGITLPEIQSLVENTDSSQIWDDSLWDEIYENENYNIAHLYDVCLSLWDEVSFNRLFEGLYELTNEELDNWETAIGMLRSGSSENYCEHPVFWNDEFRTCYSEFDRDFLNKAISVYLWKTQQWELEKYLSELNPADIQQQAYKIVFLGVLNGEITDGSDCLSI